PQEHGFLKVSQISQISRREFHMCAERVSIFPQLVFLRILVEHGHGMSHGWPLLPFLPFLPLSQRKWEKVPGSACPGLCLSFLKRTSRKYESAKVKNGNLPIHSFIGIGSVLC